jgi:hypothetical protein
MLPSAVNDTMRDMMAQIRDCGDGIRDGTYTMTAAKITGGTITGATLTGNTFTSPVISGGSINNTPIGATTANTGAFTTLSATGVTTVQAGTVSAPAITTSGDTNTGIYFPAADTIAFTEGGVESMRIDSSGRLGIGTTSPSTPLEIKSPQFTDSEITLDNTSSNTTSRVLFKAAGTEYGRVSGDSTQVTLQAGNIPMVFRTNSSERMRIDSSGNVGIGSTNPLSKLEVVGGQFRVANTSTAAVCIISTDSTSTNGITIESSYYGGAGYGPMKFNAGGSERMRIDSSGRILLGTTSTSTFDAGFRLNPTGTGGSTQVALSTTGGGTPFLLNTTADTNIINFYRSSTNVGTISVSTTNTAYNTSSDYRLKENIAPMTGALAKVTQLKPCTYTWKANGSAGQGFIAHELQAVVPDSVTGVKDAVDAEGNPVHQGVDTSYLVATLTAAIQELNAKVEAQAVRIAELESK